MTDPPLRDTFTLGVVGRSGVLADAELEYLLDTLVADKVAAGFRVVLLADGDSPGVGWAESRGHEVQPVLGGHPVRGVCDVVATAQAVVVIGEPEPFRLLLWLCDQAGIPARVLRRPAPSWRPAVRATNLPD